MFDGFFIPSTETFEERDLFEWLRQREETGWLDGLFKADAGTTGKGAPAAPTVKQPGAGTGAGGGAGAPSVHAPSVSTGGGGGASAKLGSEMPSHRWLRRELKGSKTGGGNEYRYFYTEGQGLGRVAKEGAEVNLGHKKGTDDHIRVTKVDRENNKISYKKLKANRDDAGQLTHFDEHEGEHTTDTKGWNSMMEQHFGDSHHTATDARVRRWANAVYTKVPHEVFKQTWDDATGSKMTGDQIVAHLKASSDKVHQKMGKSLERTFKQNGIGDEHDAREAIGFLLSRRGWHPSARAAMLGMMEHGGYEAARVAKNYRTIARSAEKAAKNGMVTGAHLHAALRGTKTVGQYHEAKSSRMATLLHEHNEDLHKRGEQPVSMEDFQMFRKAQAGKQAWESRQKNKENTPTQKRMFGKVEDMSADEFAAWHAKTKEKEDKREKKFTEEFLDSPLPAAAASEEEKAAPHAEGKLVEQLTSAKGGAAGARENKELDAYVKGLSPEQKEAWDRNHEHYLQKWRDARAAREAGKKAPKAAPGVSQAPAGIDYTKDTAQARGERLANPNRRRESGTISPDLQRDFVDRLRQGWQGKGEPDYPSITRAAQEASAIYEKKLGDKVPVGLLADAWIQYSRGAFPDIPRHQPGGGQARPQAQPQGQARPPSSMAEGTAAEMYGQAGTAPDTPTSPPLSSMSREDAFRGYAALADKLKQHSDGLGGRSAQGTWGLEDLGRRHSLLVEMERHPGYAFTDGAQRQSVEQEKERLAGAIAQKLKSSRGGVPDVAAAVGGGSSQEVGSEDEPEQSLHDRLHDDAKLAYQGADDDALADVRRRFEAARGQLTPEEGEALHRHISDIEQRRAQDKEEEVAALPERDVGAGAKQYHTAQAAGAVPVSSRPDIPPPPPGRAPTPPTKPIKDRAPSVHDTALDLVQQGLDQYGSPLEGRWPQGHLDSAHAAVTQALAASATDIAQQDPSVRQTPSLLERMRTDFERVKQGGRKEHDLSGVFASVGDRGGAEAPARSPQQAAAEVLSNSLWDVNNREQHERPGHLAAVEQLVDEQHRRGIIGATEHRNLHVQLQNAKQRHGIEPHPVDQDVELAGQAATHSPDDVAEHLRDAVEGVHRAAAQGDADAGVHAEKVLAAVEELEEQGNIDEATADEIHDELGDVVASHPAPEAQEQPPVLEPPPEAKEQEAEGAPGVSDVAAAVDAPAAPSPAPSLSPQQEMAFRAQERGKKHAERMRAFAQGGMSDAQKKGWDAMVSTAEGGDHDREAFMRSAATAGVKSHYAAAGVPLNKKLEEKVKAEVAALIARNKALLLQEETPTADAAADAGVASEPGRAPDNAPAQTAPAETPTADAAGQDPPVPAAEDAREPDVLPPRDVATLGGAAQTSSDMVLDTTPSVDVERKYTLPRKDFPAHIKQALKEQKHNRKDYEIRVGNTFSPWGSATEGTRPHTSLVDLKTGKVRHSEGAWGGDDLLAQVSSLHDPNQDYKAKHEIPKGHAIVVGQTGYEPATTAHIHMRPEDYDAYFGANVTSNQVPTAAQKKVLDALSMMSHARERHFQENKLGAYSPSNSRVKELIELGWVQPTSKGGLQLTTKGKNAQRLLGIAGVPYKKEDATPPSARTVVHDVEVEGAPSTAPALEALSGAAQSTLPLAAPTKKEEPLAPAPTAGRRPSFVRNAPHRRGAGLMPSDDELAQMGQAAESAPSAPSEAKPLASPLGSAASAEGGQGRHDFEGLQAAHGVTPERARHLQQHFGVPASLEEGRQHLSTRNTALQRDGFGIPSEHAARWKGEHSDRLHDALSTHVRFPRKILRSKYANGDDRVHAKDAEKVQRFMGDGYSPSNHAQQPLTDADMNYMREVRNAVKDHVAQVGKQPPAYAEGVRKGMSFDDAFWSEVA